MIKKHGNAVFFCIALNVGAVRPKPRHKGLFVKSPLESQKLRQNKVMYFGAKFFGLPFSERKVSYFMSVTMPINTGILFSLSNIIYTKGLSRTTSFVVAGVRTAVFVIVTPVTAAAFVPFSLTVICVL